jgi:hypothetical protein
MMKKRFLDYLNNTPFEYEENNRPSFRIAVEENLRKFLFDHYLIEMKNKMKWNVIVKYDKTKGILTPKNYANTDKVFLFSVNETVNLNDSNESKIEFILYSDNKEIIVYWLKEYIIGDFSVIFNLDEYEIEYRIKK